MICCLRTCRSSKSLRFILNLKMNSSFITSWPGLRINANNKSMQVQSNTSNGLEANAHKKQCIPFASVEGYKMINKNWYSERKTNPIMLPIFVCWLSLCSILTCRQLSNKSRHSLQVRICVSYPALITNDKN